jgi:phosphoribosylformylglycinamidine synthase
MKATVAVTLKPGLLDVQGKATQQALESLGFKGIKQVRVGKLIAIELNHATAAATKRDLERMCQKLLANPVVETYRVNIVKR